MLWSLLPRSHRLPESVPGAWSLARPIRNPTADSSIRRKVISTPRSGLLASYSLMSLPFGRSRIRARHLVAAPPYHATAGRRSRYADGRGSTAPRRWAAPGIGHPGHGRCGRQGVGSCRPRPTVLRSGAAWERRWVFPPGLLRISGCRLLSVTEREKTIQAGFPLSGKIPGGNSSTRFSLSSGQH
jgi:hypothetical protein